ncbi:hypothetical protein BH09VER1_BH09VER1_49380 [soil metagenome]
MGVGRAPGSVVIHASDDPAETVKYLVAKADVVIVGTTVGEVYSMGSAPIDGSFYPRPYFATVSVDRLLHGGPLLEKQLKVCLSRIGRDGDGSGLASGKYVLFLKRPKQEGGRWTSADVLLGVFPYDPGLEAALAGRLDFRVMDQ